MNVFGAFNFGRLIKTFLPGVMLLLGVVLILDAASYWLNQPPHRLARLIAAQGLIATALAVPLSLILGIFCNMVFYAYANDRLIRQKFKTDEPVLHGFKEHLLARVIEHLEKQDTIPKEKLAAIRGHLDLEALLLPKIDLAKLVFLQESYWYYLEFQLNILLAIVFVAFSSSIHIFTYASVEKIGLWGAGALIASGIVVTCIGCRMCIVSARKNYRSHIAKTNSYYLSLLPEFLEPKNATSDPSPAAVATAATPLSQAGAAAATLEASSPKTADAATPLVKALAVIAATAAIPGSSRSAAENTPAATDKPVEERDPTPPPARAALPVVILSAAQTGTPQSPALAVATPPPHAAAEVPVPPRQAP